MLITKNINGTDVSYDTEEFGLSSVERDGKRIMGLVYVGDETDGSKINVPYGIVYMDNMFTGRNIKSLPNIPDTVESIDSAFAECANLREIKSLPSGIKSMNYAFANCRNLVSAGNMPENLRDARFAFQNCCNLASTGDMPIDVGDVYGMYVNCSNLRRTGALPVTAVDRDDMFEFSPLEGAEQGIKVKQSASKPKTVPFEFPEEDQAESAYSL